MIGSPSDADAGPQIRNVSHCFPLSFLRKRSRSRNGHTRPCGHHLPAHRTPQSRSPSVRICRSTHVAHWPTFLSPAPGPNKALKTTKAIEVAKATQGIQGSTAGNYRVMTFSVIPKVSSSPRLVGACRRSISPRCPPRTVETVEGGIK